ncbi:YkgJ family cysteine cluster protein [bacterium]|nr:YkgJ family cysteine cluster protein [bacterium]
MSALPSLRRGVVLGEQSGPEGRRFYVEDPLLGFKSSLDEAAWRVARVLDGNRDREGVLALLASEGATTSAEQIDGLLRFLDAYSLLENDRARKRLAAETRGEPPLKLLPGAKYACQASGFCCQSSYSFGPVEDHVRLRVLQEDWSSEIPEVRERFGGDQKKLFVQQGKLHFLTPVQGRCVFLSPDRKCLIHKKLGYEAKPLICRVFPFVFVGAPDGVYVSLRFECRTLHSGRVIGVPLEERQDELRGYVKERASSGDVRPIVLLAPEVPIGFEDYSRIERALLASLDRKDLTPEEHLLALRDIACGVASALPRHPTEEETARALASLDASAPRRSGDRAACFRGFLDIADELTRGVARIYSRLAKIVKPADFNRIMHDEFLLVLLSAMRRGADRAGVEHPAPPVKNLERVEAVSHDTSDPHVSGLYVDWFRNEVFGKYLTHAHGLLPALGNLACRYALVRWNARIRANGRGAERVSSADVMDSLILVNRLFHVDYLLDPIAKMSPRFVRFFESLVLDSGPP